MPEVTADLLNMAKTLRPEAYVGNDFGVIPLTDALIEGGFDEYATWFQAATRTAREAAAMIRKCQQVMYSCSELLQTVEGLAGSGCPSCKTAGAAMLVARWEFHQFEPLKVEDVDEFELLVLLHDIVFDWWKFSQSSWAVIQA